MKFTRTLVINAKETSIIFEAMKMYASHLDACQKSSRWGDIGPVRFNSYKSKVLGMLGVIKAIKESEMKDISEASVFGESFYHNDHPNAAPPEKPED